MAETEEPSKCGGVYLTIAILNGLMLIYSTCEMLIEGSAAGYFFLAFCYAIEYVVLSLCLEETDEHWATVFIVARYGCIVLEVGALVMGVWLVMPGAEEGKMEVEL